MYSLTMAADSVCVRSILEQEQSFIGRRGRLSLREGDRQHPRLGSHATRRYPALPGVPGVGKLRTLTLGRLSYEPFPEPPAAILSWTHTFCTILYLLSAGLPEESLLQKLLIGVPS